MEKLSPKQNKEMLFVGHLDEMDDLKKYKRDAPLTDTEKNKEDLDKIVEAVTSKIRESNKKAVMFVTSPRIRAKETANLVADEVKKILGTDIKIRYVSEDNLRAPEQGELILPENYTPGSFFEGLKIASEIFYEESLGPNQNRYYKYGDPILKPNGSYKYPELAKYFKTSGETYAEALTRILTAIVEMSQKVEKLNSSVEVVLVAHGFTYEILRGLSILAEKIKKEDIHMKTGDIPNRLSEIYENRTNKLRDTAYAPLKKSYL